MSGPLPTTSLPSDMSAAPFGAASATGDTSSSFSSLSAPLPHVSAPMLTTPPPITSIGGLLSDLSLSAPPPSVRYPSHPALSLSNIRAHVSEVLNYTNFLLWRELFLPIFQAYQVADHVDGTLPPPSHSPDYALWCQIDALVLSWIQSTVSRDILHSIISPRSSMTAFDAWSKIDALFRDHVESRIVQLRQEFYSIKKGDKSMKEFLLRLKDLYDCRISVGDIVSSRDLLLQIVMGLGPEYNTITSIFATQTPAPTFDQMKSMLFLEEAKLAAQKQSPPVFTDQVLVAQQTSAGRGSSFPGRGSRGSGRGTRGRSGGRGSFLPFRPRSTPGISPGPSILGHPPSAPVTARNYQLEVTCYRCGGLGHTTRSCPSVLKSEEAPSQEPHQAFHIFPSSDAATTSWIFYSGASTHMTNDVGSTQEGTTSPLQ